MAADRFKLKRGTTIQVQAYTPQQGEPVYDTTLKQLSIGDGTTAGGVVSPASKLTTARTIAFTGNVTGSGSFDGSANLSIAATVAAITGITTGAAAATGQVGEILTGTTSGTSLTTGGTANIASLSLTAGVWAVTGTGQLVPASTVTSWGIGLSTTSATQPSFQDRFVITGASLGGLIASPPVSYINISATTTVYLVSTHSFASTATANGYIKAIRIR